MIDKNGTVGTLDIAVVGAGILGLATAVRLVERGARVILIDEAGAIRGTSGTSFAWVNSNGKQPRSYHDLNTAGLAGHVAWQADLPDHFRWFRQTGAYEWVNEAELHLLQQRVQDLRDIGYSASIENASHARRTNPGLHIPDVEIAWFPQEGYVDIPRFAAWALSRLIETGSAVRFGQTVVKIERKNGRGTLTLNDGDTVHADRVVLTAGRWTRPLLAELGYDFAAPEPLDPTPRVRSMLAYTQPLPVQVYSLLFGPNLNIRPDGGNRLVLQSLELDTLLSGESDLSPNGAMAREFQRRLRHLLPSIPQDAIQELRIGRRSLTSDGLPAIGWLDEKIYILATHSGVTLAPVLSGFAAEEIIALNEQQSLAPFRPQRLLKPLGKSSDLRPPSLQ
ncbi:FAD-binding oxidoreductase [Agrobacterium sp. AGB01]|uniref:NAD(P)/FAD-dependent oxidoreductase n=1 Tax=Agrobacterium sp. AGB01 TaxID=2769302 RepID=UPI00177C7967|nr:FAD-binding oxidoreductase [Agrobacterium sp. AGB01]MBD9388548.1 FAD-binding oxidoreductase [Agrobacterium sp. AGB01]